VEGSVHEAGDQQADDAALKWPPEMWPKAKIISARPKAKPTAIPIERIAPRP